MWTLLKEETRRWMTTARNAPKYIKRYNYPSKIGPINYSSDLQHRLQKNDIDAYTESGRRVKHIVNYKESAGNKMTDADGNILLNFSAKNNIVGYNHQEMIYSLKHRLFDNHLNQSLNVNCIESNDYEAHKRNILSTVKSQGLDVVFTPSSGSLALNLAAIVAREFKAKDLDVSPYEISYITFKGDNNGDSLAFTQDESLPTPESHIRLDLPRQGESKPRLEEIESLFAQNQKIGVVFIQGYQTLTGEESDLTFYQELQRLCLRYKVFLAVNETQSGFGASGDTWWAHQKWQLDQPPQFIIFGGRSQAAGFFAPTSLVQMLDLQNRNESLDVVDIVKMSKIIDIIRKQDLLPQISTRGQQMKLELEEVKIIEETRGRGANITLHLNQDAQVVVSKLHQKGICAQQGKGKNTLVLQPDYLLDEGNIMTLKKAMEQF